MVPTAVFAFIEPLSFIDALCYGDLMGSILLIFGLIGSSQSIFLNFYARWL